MSAADAEAEALRLRSVPQWAARSCSWPSWSPIVLFAGGGGYRVTAEFVNAGQLVKGSEVRVAGHHGRHRRGDRRLARAGRPRSTFTVDDDYAPLRRGTQATVKPTSLSGIANRYIDLQLGPDDGARHRRRRARSGPTTPRPPWSWTRSSPSSTGRRAARCGASSRARRTRCAGAAPSCAGASTTSTRRSRPAAASSRS